jgi:hypothetical protein
MKFISTNITIVLVALLLVVHHHQQTTNTNALILKSDGTKRPSSTTSTSTSTSSAVNHITEVNDIYRRTSLTRVAATIAAGVASSSGIGSLLFGSSSSSIPVAMAATNTAPAPNGAEAFVGTYTDPINHPGGKRTIKLLDGQKIGDYQLAEVIGGGGRGEPESYILPAVVIGDSTIIIDFSPKGGPRDFTGVLDKGDIKFLRDGNRWPRQ